MCQSGQTPCCSLTCCSSERPTSKAWRCVSTCVCMEYIRANESSVQKARCFEAPLERSSSRREELLMEVLGHYGTSSELSAPPVITALTASCWILGFSFSHFFFFFLTLPPPPTLARMQDVITRRIYLSAERKIERVLSHSKPGIFFQHTLTGISLYSMSAFTLAHEDSVPQDVSLIKKKNHFKKHIPHTLHTYKQYILNS